MTVAQVTLDPFSRTVELVKLTVAVAFSLTNEAVLNPEGIAK